MTRIWYCANCGYEVRARGRCHACKEKLAASALPELPAGPEDDEVGYRIDGWTERDRSTLIIRLNDFGISHRFEDEELVVGAADEERVDDLIAVIAENLEATAPARRDPMLDSLLSGGARAGDQASGPAVGGEAGASGSAELLPEELDGSVAEAEAEDPTGRDAVLAGAVQLLADAAARLHKDPTDMQADGDVAEASATVFLVEDYGPFDTETWSAVGRVTRRLLALLGAEEALDDGIRNDAAVLIKLLGPLAPAGAPAGPLAGEPQGEKTVYELPEWMPEQRAELSVLLDRARIAYAWEADELLVPASREDDTERLFGQVAGAPVDDDDDSDEERYGAVAELFAACGRLATDPGDDSKRDAVLDWIARADGSPLIGMDEVDWFRIVSRMRALATSIEEKAPGEQISREADEVHDLLRPVL